MYTRYRNNNSFILAVSQTFLHDIDRELYTQYQIHFQNNVQSWFFPQETDPLQTLIITVAKAVIYKSRNKGKKPETTHMLNLLRIEAQKEQLASRLKNKIESFENKWKT